MNDAEMEGGLEKFLETVREPVSEADVAAGTGIELPSVRRLLYQVMHRYECCLQVREDGTLVFDFVHPLQRIGRPTLWERVHGAGRAVWRGLSWVYRVSLAVTLVAYAIAFVVLMIAAALAASAAAKDEGPAVGAFRLVGAIFRGIFEFTTHSALIYADVDGYGYRHRHFEPTESVFRKPGGKERKKAFVASVYDFVLGPDRVQIDSGAQSRELASFVRRSGGALTVADVQALSGMSREQSERFFARFVAEFEGEAVITAEGTLVATFRELLATASQARDEEPVYFWDEYEPPHELTGNSTGRNVGVGALAAFNLAGAFAVITGTGALPTAMAEALPPAALAALGVVPMIIFSFFFLIPALRWPVVWWRNRKHHRTNIRKRLYRAIFGTREERVRFAEIVTSANERRTTEEELATRGLRSLLEETAAELGATYEMDDADELAMDATTLRREIAAREAQVVEVEAESVIFSTR
jgi:hypothetical protein